MKKGGVVLYPYKINKTKNLIILLTAWLTLFCVPVYANPNPYFSLQLGLNHYDLPEVDAFLGEGGETVRTAIGQVWDTGERFKIGLEVGSNFITTQKGTPFTLFAYEYGTYESKRFSIDALSVLEMNIYRGFNIFANAGVAYTWSKYKQFKDYSFFSESHYITDESGSYSDLRPKGGLGMGIDINKKVSVNLTLNHEFADDGGTAALIGLRYSFT